MSAGGPDMQRLLKTIAWLETDRLAVNRLYQLFLLGMFLLAAAILSLSALSGDSSMLIISDGKGYYSWLRSLALDGDLHFANDYQLLYPPDPLPPEFEQVTPNGLVPNKYSIGLGLLEIPGFLLGHLLAKLTPYTADGVSLPYQLSITLWLVIFALASFYGLYVALTKLGVTKLIAAITCSVTILASNLFYYFTKEPAMVHLANAALINILIFLSQVDLKRPAYHRSCRLLAGCLLGWLLINRGSNLALLPFFLCIFWHDLRKSTIWTYVAGMGFMAGIYLASLAALWGGFTVYSYKDEGFTGGLVGIVGTLLGDRHGLFIYHPLYLIFLLLNVWGLVEAIKTRDETRPDQLKLSHLYLHLTILLSFLGLWMFNGNWWAWWFGDSFGNRGFIEILIPLMLGATLVITQKLQKLALAWQLGAIAIAGILIISNFNLWAGYLLGQYPHDGNHTMFEAYFWFLS
ncbi:MAG: hypothetical protein AAGF24_02955 [Cyanobacteria bacterium P01_H01_bin.121]